MAIKKIKKKKMTSKEIKNREKILKALKDKEGKGEIVHSVVLPPDASLVEVIKWEVCKEIIKFKHNMDFTSKKMSELMGVDKSRTSEILHYRVDSFTLDRLLGCLESLRGYSKGTDKKLDDLQDFFKDDKKSVIGF